MPFVVHPFRAARGHGQFKDHGKVSTRRRWRRLGGKREWAQTGWPAPHFAIGRLTFSSRRDSRPSTPNWPISASTADRKETTMLTPLPITS